MNEFCFSDPAIPVWSYILVLMQLYKIRGLITLWHVLFHNTFVLIPFYCSLLLPWCVAGTGDFSHLMAKYTAGLVSSSNSHLNTPCSNLGRYQNWMRSLWLSVRVSITVLSKLSSAPIHLHSSTTQMQIRWSVNYLLQTKSVPLHYNIRSFIWPFFSWISKCWSKMML